MPSWSGCPVTYRSDDFAVVSADTTTSGFAFQRAPDHVPRAGPTGPPQQMHLDVMVVDVAGQRVLALGAVRAPAGDHVHLDPAGHPFCLVPRPGLGTPDRQ